MNSNTNKQQDHELKRSHQQQRRSHHSSSSGERPAPIMEQQPIMRSVAISPASHHQRTLHFEPALRRVDPGGLAHLRPLRGVSEPQLIKTPGTVKLPPPMKIHSRSKSESNLVRKWHVEHATLESRPTDFPPLRTTRTVLATPAHVISNRISDCLQSRSIKTKFSKSESNLAKCRNTDFCKFTIRLYSGDEGGVLVEIQRLCGDCMSFMRDCRAILDVAEGKTQDSQVVEEKPLYLRLPVSEMAFVKRASLPPVAQEEQADDDVNVTADLLSSRQSDSNMLGMESLVIQTDPLKTMKSTAILASRRILCPNDPGNTSFNMHNYVMTLVIYGKDDIASSEDSAPTPQEEHSMKLRNLAMSALFNALSLFSSENLLQMTIASSNEWYTSVLIPKLLEDLSTAENHPHDACYATRCLSILAKSSMDFAIKMQEEGGYDALKNAEEVGTREFALLARDAESCHKILTKCCV